MKEAPSGVPARSDSTAGEVGLGEVGKKEGDMFNGDLPTRFDRSICSGVGWGRPVGTVALRERKALFT
jgi:hypothetical protein